MLKKFISLLTVLSMTAGMAAVPVNAEEVSETAVSPYAYENYQEQAEQERAEAERRHEEERTKAEEERAKAEEERRELEQKRAEQRAAWGLTEPSERPTRPPKPADGEIQLMSSSEYSEVVYISTVEELLAIDGHGDGYYELKNDIDISGIDWSTLYLRNATFNGGGHTIIGMSITKEPGTKHFKTQWVDEYDGTVYEEEWDKEIRDIGFFSGYDNYVYDLNFSGAKIDVTVTDMTYGNISIIGEAYADTCKLYGSINVVGSENSSGNNVYGLNSGNDCEAEISITAENTGSVYGITECSNSTFAGDITADGGVEGIRDSDNSTFTGDITSGYYVDGINNSDNSTFMGNITADGGVCGIENSDNSIFEGDITVTFVSSYSHTHGINNSNNSTFEGNITTEGHDAYVGVDAIAYCSSCSFLGNITSNGSVDGIVGGDNCSFIGDVSAEALFFGAVSCGINSSNNSTFMGNFSVTEGGFYGISKSDNCTFKGAVTSLSSYIATGIEQSGNCIFIGDINSQNYANGIEYSNDCAFEGNIEANSWNRRSVASHGGVATTAIGISGSANCYISGSFTIKDKDYILTVSNGSPYQGAFRCSRCDTTTVSNKDLSGIVHCYDEYGSPREYSKVKEMFYDDNTVAEPPSAEDEPTAPPQATPTVPTPTVSTPLPATYTIQIADETSEEPLAGADVIIDGNTYTTDENGVISLSEAPRRSGLKVEMGGSVVYTDAAFSAIPNTMNTIYVKPLNLEKEDIFAGNNDSTQITGPEVNLAGYTFPIFSMPYNMDYELFDSLKVAYNAKDKTFQVLIGGQKELFDVAVDANSSSWKKTFEEFKEEYNQAKNGLFDYTSNTGAPGTLGISGNMDTRGFMEIKLADGSMQVSGGVVVKLTGSVEYCHYFIPAVYAVFSLSGELGGELKWELVNTSAIDPKINFTGTINAGLTPSVGIGAGARAIVAAELGLEGSLNAAYKFPGLALRDALEVKLSASFYGTIYALGHPFKESRNFPSLELYPDFGYVETMSIDEPDTYTINREYLNGASVMANEPDTVIGNLYPYSSVKAAQLSDGRVIMVWIDDDTERNSMDRTALYYSILDNGAWSEARQIDNDGTADFDFDLCASGNTAAMVWQNAETQLADDASLDATAAVTGLKYAEFDGGEWNVPISVTDGNSGYEYSPKLYYDGSIGYIVWTENEDNAALHSFDAAENVYSASVNGGSVSGRTAEYENMRLVYDTAAGANGMTACIADKDGDYTTADGILYVDGMECHTSDNSVSGLCYADGGFCFSENGVLRKSDGKSSYAAEIYSGQEGTEPRLLINSQTGAKAAVYELQDGFDSNLYASYYENDAWTNPVPVTEYEEKIRSWDAWLADDGSIGLSAVLADISVNGEEMNQAVRLSQTMAAPIENIAALYIDTDDAVTRGKTAKFNIGIENRSRAKELTVTITSDKCGELYSGTAAAEDVISISAAIPEDFEKQTLTAYVTGAENDTDLSDNSVSAVFGAADPAVELRGGAIFRTGAVSAVVSNNGCEGAENVVVTLKSESGDEIASERIGTLSAGGKKTVRFTLDKSYYTFEGEYDSALISAEVTTDTEDAAAYNNSTYYVIRSQSVERLCLDSSSVCLQPGSAYSARVTPYPAIDGDVPMYYSSDNESVATVDENGVITAVGNGRATISYMTPGALMTSRLTVYVHELGTPEIVSAEYTEYGSEDDIYGDVKVTVNTLSCLAEGEKAQMITAAYAEDGSLIGINTIEATAAGNTDVQISTTGKKPKRIKVMLWNSLTGMKPSAYSAEREIAG